MGQTAAPTRRSPAGPTALSRARRDRSRHRPRAVRPEEAAAQHRAGYEGSPVVREVLLAQGQVLACQRLGRCRLPGAVDAPCEVAQRRCQEHVVVAQRMPVAVFLGGDPVFTFSATAPLPDGLDEFLLAGYLRGWTDIVISRAIDIWMAFPPVLFSILLIAVLGPGLTSIIIAIVVIDWTRFARVVRAEAMAQGAMDYVASAQVAGFSLPSRRT